MSEYVYASTEAIEIMKERGVVIEKDGKIYYDDMEVIEIIPEVKHEIHNHS